MTLHDWITEYTRERQERVSNKDFIDTVPGYMVKVTDWIFDREVEHTETIFFSGAAGAESIQKMFEESSLKIKTVRIEGGFEVYPKILITPIHIHHIQV